MIHLTELRFTLRNHKLRLIERHGRCAYCYTTENLTLDHIIPKSAGGLNDPSNLVLACQKCNCRKGNKELSQWLTITGQSLTEILEQRVLD